MTESTDPTHCDICKNPITDRWVQDFNDKGEVLESRCAPCDRAKRAKAFQETKRLRTRMVEDAQIHEIYKECDATDYAVLAAFFPIPQEIKAFERDVWFGGLQEIATKAKTKGTSLKKDDLQLLCFTMCGRAMITLDSPTASVTVITAEDSNESRMGFRSIDATADQAIELLRKARELWAQGLRTKEDSEVRYF